jgi:FkbM family methyltransferase
MPAGSISTRVMRIPPFTDPRVRKAVLRERERLGRVRRRGAERLGSDRWSRPALHDMDRKLERWLPERDGYFVEAGANNGYLQSNTYWFERFRGWRGVLVEPIPELYEACRIERPSSLVFNCALVPEGDDGTVVHMTYGGLMSLVRGAQGSEAADREHATAGNQLGWDVVYDVEVPGRTLTSILDEAGADHVDLLSLDIEGFEASALRGLDIERFPPRFALIEISRPERRPEIERVLGERFEAVEELSPLDVLYRRRG